MPSLYVARQVDENLYQTPSPYSATSSLASSDSLEHFRKFPASIDIADAKYKSATEHTYLQANPNPIYLSAQFVKDTQLLSNGLHAAVSDIVSRWWSDEEKKFYERIPLDAKIENVLVWLQAQLPDYYNRTGSWRPDFLIDGDEKGTVAKICEINARFPFHGGFLCDILQNYLREGYAKSGGKVSQQMYPASTGFAVAFAKPFDNEKTVFVLKGREHGYDLHLFQAGAGVRFIAPEDVKMFPSTTSKTGFTLVDVNTSEEITQVVLELHQDEMMKMSTEMLKQLAVRAQFNDLRTIFLAHDKRMLAIVTAEVDDLVYRGVLTDMQAAALRRGIAESVLPGTDAYRKVATDRHEWLYKPAGRGKGEGIVFGADVSEEEWYDLLSAGSPHVLQRRVHQRVYDMTLTPTKLGGEPRSVSWPVVGTYFSVNGIFTGFGPMRTSASDLCALSTGGTWLAPVTDAAGAEVFAKGNPSRLTPSNRIRAASLSDASSPEHVQRIVDDLHTTGLAIVDVGFADPESDYLVHLVRDGLHAMHGHGLPVDHSLTRGWLWDVKPKHGIKSTNENPLARSETMNVFPWHTDCSFDANPPRFFALHVVHADRFGGGHLSVLNIEDLVANLSAETVEALKQPEFDIEVPHEFFKGEDYAVGALLEETPEGVIKMRFRRDIMEPKTARAAAALDELDELLEKRKDLVGVFRPDFLKDNTLVVIDNARWLHARSQVRDPERHLRRVRWCAEAFP